MSRDLDAYLRGLRRDGYQIRRTLRGHWRVFSPRGKLLATTGSTPSDWRGASQPAR